MNNIIQGDCLEVLKTLESESVDCVITSPPYNKGTANRKIAKNDTWQMANISYGDFKDNLPPDEYIKQQTTLLSELVRIIKPLGSIFYNHKQIFRNHRIVFPEYVFKFNVRQIITWERGSSPQLSPIRWIPNTEFIFWITKTNVQPKFHRVGDKFDVWHIPPKVFKDHPATFPERLVSNCLLSTTDEGDTVIDPYMGSGITALVAKKNNRDFLGIELNPAYIKIAEKRLAQGVLL
jgi:site-specific DNA-methyltransferase (adenine-specific)